MLSNTPVDCTFHEGDEVVLAEGTYQGTLGVFLHLTKDPKWAEITERNGAIRMHPMVWLAHAPSRGSATRNEAALRTRRHFLQVKRNTTMPFLRESVEAATAASGDLGTWEDDGGAASALLPTKCLQLGLRWRLAI
jgi:hypothetical protein